MKVIAGVDIGNSTTECCIGKILETGKLEFISSAMVKTTGIKGTIDNITGIKEVIDKALSKAKTDLSQLDLILINKAAPVIGDTAMETITQTIITESTMIGHNPATPGGVGIGIGYTVRLEVLVNSPKDKEYIPIVSQDYDYEASSKILNMAIDSGYRINGVIVQKDEGVLIHNRLSRKVPIVDEVLNVEKVPIGAYCAVEVAQIGHTIKTLCNPYGIATIFDLNPEETKRIIPIAKSLIGIKSAVVIKTPNGDVKEKIIPAGCLIIKGQTNDIKIDVEEGSQSIMNALLSAGEILDVHGQMGTNVGGMINNIKQVLSQLTKEDMSDIHINDILALDTTLPIKVQGGLAGETFMEKAVALAAMVRTKELPLKEISLALSNDLGISVEVEGVEAVMACLGAMTTKGSKLPLAILDLGAGSTDAAVIDEKGNVKSTHLAGAGELVTMLINSELGLRDRVLAEEIKRNPLGKVESLFHIRLENRETRFFDKPLDSKYFGRAVVLKENGEDMIPIYSDLSIEKISQVRREAKQKVFITNALRALKEIAPFNNINNIPNIVLVGGCALDFEIPDLLFSRLSKHNIVCGRGNIRSEEGPRNAVATGLVMSYASKVGEEY